MTDVTAGPVVGAASGSGDNKLKRDVGLTGLTMLSLGSIIGSGWLLGTLYASQAAGPASILSWVLGGVILGVLALVHAELGSTYPVSGGTARFPFLGFGALGGFTGGWMAWIQAVTIAPIEVEATIGYLDKKFSLDMVNATTGVLTGKGILLAAGFMLLFAVINIMGVRWLAETNTIATAWKVIVPTITIVALLIASFHASNFTAGGGFMPFGIHGVFAALPLGVVFALEGFEQAIQVGGESRNPARDIPRAVIGAFIIGTLIYLLLEVAFIGAISPANVLHNWNSPLGAGGVTGPYATLATQAGLGWLATILYIDAVISPAGTGLVYVGASSRLSYGLGKNGYFPHAIDKVDRRGIPFVSIVIAFIVGMIVFLPFPSWSGLVAFVTSATVLMYAMAPVSLAALRKSDPERTRPFRLPAAGILCPAAFIAANFIVYWSGWATIFWLYVLVIIGFIIFGLYQAMIPRERRTVINWRASMWIPVWLIGLGLISYEGQFTASTFPFGLTLNPTYDLPFWWDLVTIAVFSLVVYYWAVAVRLDHESVEVLVGEAEAEAEANMSVEVKREYQAA